MGMGVEEEAGASRPGTGGSGASRNLFVGNLPFHIQWQDLKDLFRQAGAISRADVALGADGRSRGFGTVSFANEADAERAVRMFNGYEYNGRALKVHFDKFSAPAATAALAVAGPGPGSPVFAHPHGPTPVMTPQHSIHHPHPLAHSASFAQQVLQHQQMQAQMQGAAQMHAAQIMDAHTAQMLDAHAAQMREAHGSADAFQSHVYDETRPPAHPADFGAVSPHARARRSTRSRTRCTSRCRSTHRICSNS